MNDVFCCLLEMMLINEASITWAAAMLLSTLSIMFTFEIFFVTQEVKNPPDGVTTYERHCDTHTTLALSSSKHTKMPRLSSCSMQSVRFIGRLIPSVIRDVVISQREDSARSHSALCALKLFDQRVKVHPMEE